MKRKIILNKEVAYKAGVVAVGVLMMSLLGWWYFGFYMQPEPVVPPLPPVVVELPPIDSFPFEPVLFQYIEVVDSCGPYYQGECVNMRSGPGLEYPVVARLRTGVVLRVSGIVPRDDRAWYKLQPDEQLRYPERVETDWYVAADVVELVYDDGDHFFEKGVTATTSKRIIVDRSAQMLYAYDGDLLFMEQSISTGLELTPTPRGTFTIFKMTPSRYMQGPIPGVGTDIYDLPGVPWNMYFTSGGAVIHGAYWHDKFGQPWSHGCVNVPLNKAKELYLWADIGTKVIVQN